MKWYFKIYLRFKAWWYDWPVWRVGWSNYESAAWQYANAKEFFESHGGTLYFDYAEAIYYNNL